MFLFNNSLQPWRRMRSMVIYWCTYTALSQFVQFVKDCVWLLECSPASCLALRNQCEVKARNLYHAELTTNRLTTSVLTHAGTVSNFGKWMKNSFSRGKMSSFERNTNLSHLPGTLKLFWWLTYSFLFNNMTIFISRSGIQLTCFAENRDFNTCWLHFRGRNMRLLSFCVQFLQF